MNTFSCSTNEKHAFDFDWRFIKGDISDAQNPTFDDSNWRMIDAPHDWSIEDPAEPADPTSIGSQIINGPFDSLAPGGRNTAFTIGGTAWYRKHFSVPSDWSDKTVSIDFDGVYMNADVWINGRHLGCQPYGYTSFSFELSQYLEFDGDDNVIAVQVKNEGDNSRWYSGSGIYRHVWLKAVDRVHVAHRGLYVTTPEVSSETARVRVQTTIQNDTGKRIDIEFVTCIVDSQAHAVACRTISMRLSEQTPSNIDQCFDIAQPKLWSMETPTLYRVVCEITRDGQTVNRTETTFGIRSIRFDPDKGFFLNGDSVKLKGGGVHANNGPLGAAAFDRAEERRVELLKAAGFNAIRCAHNPPSPVFLDACDRLGMLVIDEAFDSWTQPHPPAYQDYHLYFNDWWRHDLTSMILRDRNHPSIILWSIGNQIVNSHEDSGVKIANELADCVRSLDPTRPVTANVYYGGEWRNCDPFFAALDVAGYSYASHQYDDDHARAPNRIIVSSEIGSMYSFDNWMRAVDREFVCGNFEWTAFDFMGEVALGWCGYERNADELFPWTVAYCGDFDICGFRRPRSYYRDVLWNEERRLSAFVHAPAPSFGASAYSHWGWHDVKPSWTWPGYEGEPLKVDVYSNFDQVRLFLNGKDLGAQETSRNNEFIASWQVSYESGELVAVGIANNVEAGRRVLRTAKAPSRIRLTVDRSTIAANGQDLSYITVEIVDDNGERAPHANELVRFDITGSGTIAAAGSSNPISTESVRQPQRRTYEGRCLTIVKANRTPGSITLTAHCDGLPDSSITIETC